MNNYNIEIDENSHNKAPSFFQRIKNAVISAGLGIILVQVIMFSGAFNSGNIAGSVVIFIDNIYFIGYLIICATLGWFSGEQFIGWLKNEMGLWKSW